MPGGDRTGPPSYIPQSRTGGGFGRNYGRRRLGGGLGYGPCGECVCVACGYREPHQRGAPCYEKKCPKCGASMTRV